MKKPEPKKHPIRAVRRAGVPLVAFETADPAATVADCIAALKGDEVECPILKWDCVRGLSGMNTAGTAVAEDCKCDPMMPLDQVLQALSKSDGEDIICFAHNLHRFIQNEAVMQAVWNLRDAWKSPGNTLIMLCPAMALPPELTHDVVIITEPLPDAAQIGDIVDSVAADAELKSIEDRPGVVDTLLGVSAFAAEQAFALSTTKSGIDREGLWDRKRKMVEQTPGLTVYRGKDKFCDVGGLENAKQILGKTISGKLGITCLVLIDELDKSMAASGTDTSGTTQDQNKVLLSYMQDSDVNGILELGSPGTGKTALAKAAAGEYGIPLVMVDLGAMKGSLVGQSEQQMRAAIKVIHGISSGRALFLGACNRTENLPPELRRRFNYSSIFFDLPDEAERTSAWKVWLKKYEITDRQIDKVDDFGWTGAEIRNCCLKAWAMDCKLSEAAKTIVPVSVIAGELVTAMRKSASGKYISASHAGLYQFTEQQRPAGNSRKIRPE